MHQEILFAYYQPYRDTLNMRAHKILVAYLQIPNGPESLRTRVTTAKAAFLQDGYIIDWETGRKILRQVIPQITVTAPVPEFLE